MDYNVFIEVPAGGSIKYEEDEKTGELFVDRLLHTSFVFPFNYGSVRDTKAEDGDPLDTIVLCSQPILPGFLVKCHAIGLMQMEDEGGIDTKIISVPDVKIDPEFGVMADIKDLPKATLAKIKHFFEHYKGLEPGKWVKIGEYEGKGAAEAVVKKSQIKK